VHFDNDVKVHAPYDAMNLAERVLTLQRERSAASPR
jgi:hypothetical protein